MSTILPNIKNIAPLGILTTVQEIFVAAYFTPNIKCSLGALLLKFMRYGTKVC